MISIIVIIVVVVVVIFVANSSSAAPENMIEQYIGDRESPHFVDN